MDDATVGAAAAPEAQQPHLVPPVQLAVQCTGCGYERTSLALHPQGVEEALRCERCAQPNRVVWYRSQGTCACCL